MTVPSPDPSPLAALWDLEPGLVYLNHGSFGACPREVLAAQSELRARMERDAVRFFVQDLWPLSDAARDAIAPVIGARPQDIVFVDNATSGVATVINSLDLNSGDEILFADQEYPACRAIIRAACARSGAVPVEFQLPWPITDPAQVTESILARVSARTRIALVSHIISGSAMVLPVAEIIEALRARNVETLLDAAHAPGSTEINLTALAPAYATANCHKWLCAPKGAAFLWARQDMQHGVRALFESVYSRELGGGPWQGPGTRSRFNLDFDYMGTQDYTARLALPGAVDFMNRLAPGGIDDVRARNRTMVLNARDLLCARFGTEPTCPDSMVASMATVRIPDHPPELAARLAERPTVYADALQNALLERHRIQAPIWRAPAASVGQGRMVRLSAQAYNAPGQYAYLADALAEELERERTGD